MLRVLGTIKNSEYANVLKNQQNDLASWIKEIHTGIYPFLVRNHLYYSQIIYLHWSIIRTQTRAFSPTTRHSPSRHPSTSWTQPPPPFSPVPYIASPFSGESIRTFLLPRSLGWLCQLSTLTIPRSWSTSHPQAI